MKLRVDQLSDHLARGLAPVYLVGGDEPLQVMEGCDAIRRAARAAGYSGREVFNAEAGFDWQTLAESANTLSLFAEQRILELRLPSGKPGVAGSKALLEYLAAPPPDTLLLLITGKLEAGAQNSKWYKALEGAGVVVQVWPIAAAQLPQWIARRMRARGMQPSSEAAALLAERVEGNLLAASQEIEKLHLLHGEAAVGVNEVLAAVVDSARFDIFSLVDAALEGKAARVARIIEGLRSEAVEPTLVLWALTREIRQLAKMAHQVGAGEPVEQVMFQYRVWEKRKTLVKQGLRRHNERRWLQLLRRAGLIDRMIKGQAVGDPWDEMLQLGLMLAGVRLFAPPAGATATA